MRSITTVYKNVQSKVLPESHEPIHTAALIFISLALRQTPHQLTLRDHVRRLFIPQLIHCYSLHLPTGMARLS